MGIQVKYLTEKTLCMLSLAFNEKSKFITSVLLITLYFKRQKNTVNFIFSFKSDYMREKSLNEQFENILSTQFSLFKKIILNFFVLDVHEWCSLILLQLKDSEMSFMQMWPATHKIVCWWTSVSAYACLGLWSLYFLSLLGDVLFLWQRVFQLYLHFKYNLYFF